MSVEIIRNALCITVRQDGEYGAFYVREGSAQQSPSERRHYCELTIHSSFGNVGYYWSHMGMPAHQFFDNTDKHYFVGKLFGKNAYQFDSARTERELKRMLLQERRQDEHTKASARKIWDALDALDSFDTVGDFYGAYCSYEELLDWTSPGDVPITNRLTHSAEGLWKLWGEFVQALKDEAVRKETPNVQPIR